MVKSYIFPVKYDPSAGEAAGVFFSVAGEGARVLGLQGLWGSVHPQWLCLKMWYTLW